MDSRILAQIQRNAGSGAASTVENSGELPKKKITPHFGVNEDGSYVVQKSSRVARNRFGRPQPSGECDSRPWSRWIASENLRGSHRRQAKANSALQLSIIESDEMVATSHAMRLKMIVVELASDADAASVRGIGPLEVPPRINR
jgi:hypothetical protein